MSDTSHPALSANGCCFFPIFPSRETIPIPIISSTPLSNYYCWAYSTRLRIFPNCNAFLTWSLQYFPTISQNIPSRPLSWPDRPKTQTLAECSCWLHFQTAHSSDWQPLRSWKRSRLLGFGTKSSHYRPGPKTCQRTTGDSWLKAAMCSSWRIPFQTGSRLCCWAPICRGREIRVCLGNVECTYWDELFGEKNCCDAADDDAGSHFAIDSEYFLDYLLVI